MVTCCWNDDKQLEMHMMLWEIGTEWRISGSMEHHKWKGDQLRMPNSSFANHLWIFSLLHTTQGFSPLASGRCTWHGFRLPGWSGLHRHPQNLPVQQKNARWMNIFRQKKRKEKACCSVCGWLRRYRKGSAENLILLISWMRFFSFFFSSPSLLVFFFLSPSG